MRKEVRLFSAPLAVRTPARIFSGTDSVRKRRCAIVFELTGQFGCGATEAGSYFVIRRLDASPSASAKTPAATGSSPAQEEPSPDLAGDFLFMQSGCTAVLDEEVIRTAELTSTQLDDMSLVLQEGPCRRALTCCPCQSRAPVVRTARLGDRYRSIVEDRRWRRSLRRRRPGCVSIDIAGNRQALSVVPRTTRRRPRAQQPSAPATAALIRRSRLPSAEVPSIPPNRPLMIAVAITAEFDSQALQL